MSLRIRYRPLALVLACGTALASCSPEPVAPTYKIQDFITSVTAQNGAVVGVLHDTDAPPSAGGPTAQLAGISTTVNGGSAGVNLSAGSTFEKVYLYSPAASGYYEVALPSGVTAEDLVVTVNSGVRPGTIRLRYAADGAGVVGPYVEQALRIIGVGTGDVQVSIAWTGKTDVDLHVIDPNGEEIYYANKTAASGGRLDLDSNPACQIDDRNNENVYFPAGASPHGTYTVVVAYYDACGQARSDWFVTVLVKGQNPQTFSGSFVGDAGSNPPVTVTSFSY